jgi:hypothetical protein
MIYFTLFLRAIPLAIGLVLTLLSAAYAIDVDAGSDNGMTALVLGVIGVPLLLASAVTLNRAIGRLPAP